MRLPCKFAVWLAIFSMYFCEPFTVQVVSAPRGHIDARGAPVKAAFVFAFPCYFFLRSSFSSFLHSFPSRWCSSTLMCKSRR
jgi:hypothetical protein